MRRAGSEAGKKTEGGQEGNRIPGAAGGGSSLDAEADTGEREFLVDLGFHPGRHHSPGKRE